MRQRQAIRWSTGVILVLAVLFAACPENRLVTAGDPPLPTLTATVESPAWFQAELGTGPVVPPPTLAGDARISDTRYTRTETGFADTEVIEGYPDANCPSLLGPEIHAGNDGPQGVLEPDGEILRSLLKFNVAGVPPQATVHRATLKLYATGSSYGYQESLPITAYGVTSLWAGKTTTWNNQPSIGGELDTRYIPFGIAGQGWYTFDMTSLVAGWVDGSYPNYGIVLRGPEVRYGWRAFADSKTIYPPQLEIEYSASPELELTIVPAIRAVQAGDSATLDLYSNGSIWLSGDVSLAVSGLPAHISHELQDTVVPTTAHTVLTLTTSPGTPRGAYVCTVTGTLGELSDEAQVTLQVSSPDFELSLESSLPPVAPGQTATATLRVTAVDGFADQVALSVSGLPSGTTYDLSTNPVQPPDSTVLSVHVAPGTAGGAYPLTVTGASGSLSHTLPVQLQVTVPDFGLTLEPSQASILVGESMTFTTHVTATEGFTDNVTLAVGRLPPATSHTWSTNPLTPAASTELILQTSQETPTGTHTIVVTGTGGSRVHSAQALLTLRDQPSTNSIYLPLIRRPDAAPLVAPVHRPALHSPSLAPGPTPLDGPASLAILSIGINDYKHMSHASAGQRAGVPGFDLDGAAPDAINTAATLRCQNCCAVGASLVPQCWCPVDTVLLDAQATKAAIHSSIVSQDGSSQVLLLTASVHGMYAPDDDGDEADGYDEFLVPYEIEYGASGWRYDMAIRDDELARWLDALPPQLQIVLLIDSCFSGGLIPTTAAQARGLDWQPGARAQMTPEAWQDGIVQDIAGNGRVILTASAEDQPSLESGVLGGGVFTYFLLEAFRTPSADENGNGWISAEEAYRYLDDRVDAFVYELTGTHQHPQISDGVPGEVDLVQLGGGIDVCPYH